MAEYTENELAKDLENQEYKFGCTTDIESEKIPVGLNEDVIRLISAKKEEYCIFRDIPHVAYRCFPILGRVTVTEQFTHCCICCEVKSVTKPIK